MTSFHSQTLKIFPASPKALTYIESYNDPKGTKPPTVGKRRYPWNQMKIGECFIESFNLTTETKLRNCVKFQRAFSGKDFIVIKHETERIFEVARIA